MQWWTDGVTTDHIIATKTNEEKHMVNTLGRYVRVKVHSLPVLKAFGTNTEVQFKQNQRLEQLSFVINMGMILLSFLCRMKTSFYIIRHDIFWIALHVFDSLTPYLPHSLAFKKRKHGEAVKKHIYSWKQHCSPHKHLQLSSESHSCTQ